MSEFKVDIGCYTFNVDIEKKIIRTLYTPNSYYADLDETSIKIFKELHNLTLEHAKLDYCGLRIKVQINIPFTDEKKEYEIVFKEEVVKKNEDFSFVCLDKEFKVIKNDKNIVMKYFSADYDKFYISKISEDEYNLLKDFVNKSNEKIKGIDLYYQYIDFMDVNIKIETCYNFIYTHLIKLKRQTEEDKLREKVLSLEETIKKLTNN